MACKGGAGCTCECPPSAETAVSVLEPPDSAGTATPRDAITPPRTQGTPTEERPPGQAGPAGGVATGAPPLPAPAPVVGTPTVSGGGSGSSEPAYGCQCVCICVPRPAFAEPADDTTTVVPDGVTLGVNTWDGLGLRDAVSSQAASALYDLGDLPTIPVGEVLAHLPWVTGLGGSTFGPSAIPLPTVPVGGANSRLAGFGRGTPSLTSGRIYAGRSMAASAPPPPAIPGLCAQSLENSSPSLKGVVYPSSLGDGVGKEFVGCPSSTTPGRVPAGFLPGEGGIEAGPPGAPWEVLGGAGARGARAAGVVDPPGPEPIVPAGMRVGPEQTSTRSGPVGVVAPATSGISPDQDPDFGPGGGKVSWGIYAGAEGLPLSWTDAETLRPPMFPGETTEPAPGGNGVLAPPGVLSHAGGGDGAALYQDSTAIGPPTMAGIEADQGTLMPPGSVAGVGQGFGGLRPARVDPGLGVRFLRTMAVGGRGGGEAGRGTKGGALAAQAIALEKELRNAILAGDWEAASALKQDIGETWAEYDRMRREHSIGKSFEEALADERERIERLQKIQAHADFLRARSATRRSEARKRRFGRISRSEDVADARNKAYEAGVAASQFARRMRADVQRARAQILNLAKKENYAKTKARVAAAKELLATANRILSDAKADLRAAEARLAKATPKEKEDRQHDVQIAKDRLKQAESGAKNAKEGLKASTFKNMVRAAERATREADRASNKVDQAARALQRAAARGASEDERNALSKSLNDAKDDLVEKVLKMLDALDELKEETEPPPEDQEPPETPEPPDGENGDDAGVPTGPSEVRGPVLPGVVCDIQGTSEKAPKAECEGKYCGKCKKGEVCIGCYWQKVAIPPEGVKGMDLQALSLQAMFAPLPMANRLTGQPPENILYGNNGPVRTPPDSAASGIGALDTAISYFAAPSGPVSHRSSPDSNPASLGHPLQKQVLRPQDSIALDILAIDMELTRLQKYIDRAVKDSSNWKYLPEPQRRGSEAGFLELADRIRILEDIRSKEVLLLKAHQSTVPWEAYKRPKHWQEGVAAGISELEGEILSLKGQVAGLGGTYEAVEPSTGWIDLAYFTLSVGALPGNLLGEIIGRVLTAKEAELAATFDLLGAGFAYLLGDKELGKAFIDEALKNVRWGLSQTGLVDAPDDRAFVIDRLVGSVVKAIDRGIRIGIAWANEIPLTDEEKDTLGALGEAFLKQGDPLAIREGMSKAEAERQKQRQTYRLLVYLLAALLALRSSRATEASKRSADAQRAAQIARQEAEARAAAARESAAAEAEAAKKRAAGEAKAASGPRDATSESGAAGSTAGGGRAGTATGEPAPQGGGQKAPRSPGSGGGDDPLTPGSGEAKGGASSSGGEPVRPADSVTTPTPAGTVGGAIERAKAAGSDQATRARAWEEFAGEKVRSGAWSSGDIPWCGKLGEKVYIGGAKNTVLVIRCDGTMWLSTSKGGSGPPFTVLRGPSGPLVEVNYARFRQL